MESEPIDDAALLLLRPLVAELERGEALVTKLDARDGPGGRELRIVWKVREQTPEISMSEASPSETADREAFAGDDDEPRPPCPTAGCDGVTVRADDDWSCRKCGRLF
jgi:hypothetical protein